MAGSRVALRDYVNEVGGYTVVWTGTLTANTNTANLTKYKVYGDTSLTNKHNQNSGLMFVTFVGVDDADIGGTLVGGPCNNGGHICTGVTLMHDGSNLTPYVNKCWFQHVNGSTDMIRCSSLYKTFNKDMKVCAQRIFHI